MTVMQNPPGMSGGYADPDSGRALFASLLVHRATDVDDVVGDHAEADPALHSNEALVTAPVEAMSAFGVVGVAYDCALYAVKVMTHGSGDTDWIVAGLMWAAEKKMNIASMSLWDNNGAVTPDEAPWEDIERAAQYAFNAGCLVVGISGNSGDRPKHWVTNPGRCPGVMAIGAVEEAKTWWTHSSYGPPELPPERAVEVTAPGVMIRSTYLGNGFAYYNGTSQACPHVAGAAALMKAIDPSLGPAQLRTRLRTTADDLGPAGQDEKFGAGLLNCINATA
jgi:subtilisin